ncbi:unnamed protein product [Arctia plantaginis]|uniref:Uncharacterized protein n=1 Tax=Arctia plantaginis TaxID=874455 RepID=A0A8S1AWD0_ARCPL|nr:unnamed protein product [Arctia plantaginis]
MFLLISGVKSYILNNELVLRDFQNEDVEQLEIVPLQSSHNIVGTKEVVKMVTNPVTDDVVDINNASYIDTDSSNVLVVANRTPVSSIRRNFLTNLMFKGIRAISWRLLKFIVCNIFATPVACTVMNVLSDEEEGGLTTPEGVARGLRFIENVIEIYHSAQKRST